MLPRSPSLLLMPAGPFLSSPPYKTKSLRLTALHMPRILQEPPTSTLLSPFHMPSVPRNDRKLRKLPHTLPIPLELQRPIKHQTPQPQPHTLHPKQDARATLAPPDVPPTALELTTTTPHTLPIPLEPPLSMTLPPLFNSSHSTGAAAFNTRSAFHVESDCGSDHRTAAYKDLDAAQSAIDDNRFAFRAEE